MASGLLGNAALAANAATTIYTVPAGKTAAVSINVCNRGAAASKVSIAFTTQAGAALPADYIEYQASVIANGVLERGGQLLGAGEKVVVTDSLGTCSVRVHGYEN